MRFIKPSEPIAIRATGKFCVSGGCDCQHALKRMDEHKCALFGTRLTRRTPFGCFLRGEQCLRDEVKD